MEKPFPAYDGPETYVFVCYSHEDKNLVYPEITWLHETGHRIWYDEGIPPTSEWSESLALAIDGCSIFLYFVTPRSVASEHCRREVNYALEQSCLMVTVHLTEADLPHGLKLTLSNRQAILRYEYSQSAYQQKLREALRGVERTGSARSARTLQFRLGEHLVRPDLNQIDDERIEPKTMDVLLALADVAPEPLTREELLEHVWQDLVVVDNVVHKAVARLRRTLGDEAKQPKYIETIPRRGYRLIAALEPHVAHGGSTQKDKAKIPGGSETDDLSVTVIPFVAIENAQSARARELTVDLRGHFANYHELTTVDSVGNEPAVAGGKQVTRYKVEATLGSSGALRVALARASDERVLWSEEFRAASDEETKNRRARPWVIASILRNQLAFEHECDQIRRKTRVAEAADAICASLLELHYAWISDGMTDPELVLPRVQRAIDLDPGLVDAHVRYAETQLALADLDRAPDLLEAGRLAHDALDRALELEPNDPMIFAARASVESAIYLDYESARWTIQKAIALAPLHPNAHRFQFVLARVALQEGRLTDALDHFRRAVQLNDAVVPIYSLYARALNWADHPREADRITGAGLQLVTGGLERLLLLDQKARAEDMLGNSKLARATIEDAIADVRPDSRFSIASLLARSGQSDEARIHAAKLESMEHPPIGTMVYLYAYLRDKDRGFHWLRKAVDRKHRYVLWALRNDQNFDVFRSDPRWEELLRQLETAEVEGRERNRDRAAS